MKIKFRSLREFPPKLRKLMCLATFGIITVFVLGYFSGSSLGKFLGIFFTGVLIAMLVSLFIKDAYNGKVP